MLPSELLGRCMATGNEKVLDLVRRILSVVTKFAGLLVKLRDGHQMADYAQ
jgi:hypothetical protein